MNLRRYCQRHWRALSTFFLATYSLLFFHTATLLPSQPNQHNTSSQGLALFQHSGLWFRDSVNDTKHIYRVIHKNRSQSIQWYGHNTNRKYIGTQNRNMTHYNATQIKTPASYNDTINNVSDKNITHVTNQYVPSSNTSEIRKSDFPYTLHWKDVRIFTEWYAHQLKACNSSFIAYNASFIKFKDMYIDLSLAEANAKGGEDIAKIMNRKDEDEMYKFRKGFYNIICDKDQYPKFVFGKNVAHLSEWLKVLGFSPSSNKVLLDNKTASVIDDLTIAVTRYEYANVYWTVMDIYNAYLMMHFFNHTPETTRILWVDARPHSQLDDLWAPLFKTVGRLSSLSPITKLKHFVWSVTRAKSPMLNKRQQLPLLKEFKQFVFSKYGIEAPSGIECNATKVLFVWRRDYVAHPRNPGGLIKRKITNEKQLINETKNAFPDWVISGKFYEYIGSGIAQLVSRLPLNLELSRTWVRILVGA